MMRSLCSKLLLVFAMAAPLHAQVPSNRANCTQETPPARQGSPTVAPIEVSNNHVFVKVCVRGQSLEFILDTGAGSSFFDLGTAERLGFERQSSFNVRGAGAGS